MVSVDYHVSGNLTATILDLHIRIVGLVRNRLFMGRATVTVAAVPYTLAVPEIWLVLILATTSVIDVDIGNWWVAHIVVRGWGSCWLGQGLVFKRPTDHPSA